MTILGINYAPETSGIAPYTTGLAEGLSERGHRVRVVTAQPHYPQWRVAPGHRRWVTSEIRGDIGIRRVLHYVPSRPAGLARALSEATFGLRAIGSPWHAPDVIVCVSPALISSAMAMFRAQHGRRKPAMGLIVQDLYSAGVAETSSAGSVVEKVLTKLESRVARKAAGVVVIHDRFARRMADRLGVADERMTVVRNWTHVDPVPPFDRELERARLGWTGQRVVLHAGAMGSKQGLGNVVEAARIAEAQGSDVYFVLLGDGGQRRSLERLSQGAANLRFLDPLPSNEFGRAMRCADVLLVNEQAGVIEMAVPSKLTSYFSTGVPVLAATDAGSTTAEEVVASGAGVVTKPGDPRGLFEAVVGLLADPARRRDIGARGPEYCDNVLSRSASIDAYDAWIRELAARAGQERGQV